MSSRRRAALAAAIVAGALGIVVVPRLGGSSSVGAEEADTESVTPQRTSAVTIATLTSTQEFNADLGFGEQRGLSSQRPGVITWVPEVGQQISVGDILWEIDNQPVVYMPGELPMYRELYRGAKKGEDILQLEEFLIAQGFGPEGWVADNSFNNRTRAAVKAFQKERGMTQDGVLGPGNLVVGSSPIRVETRANKGDRTEAGPILFVTESVAKVSLTATSRQLANFQKTPEVTVILGDGSELLANLDKVKSTPADENGSFGYEISYAVQSGASGSVSEAQPVKIKLVQVLATDALTVPVDALIALAEGGYAVEVRTPGGTVLRGVEVLDFDDTIVAISGEIAEGDEVVVAS